MKSFFRWIFRFLVTVVVLVIVVAIVVLLSLNVILSTYLEHRIRTETGMNADIGDFTFSLSEPTVTVKNLKLYNPPDFGGTLFLDIPEIHVEYDLDAIKQHKLHITLLRFDLAELDVVKNEAGHTNFFVIAETAAKKGPAPRNALQARGIEFTSIDTLNVSVGKVAFVDLKKPGNNRNAKIGLQNVVVKNVKSEADLYGLVGLVWLRGGGAVGLPDNPNKRKPVMIFETKP